MTSVHAVLSARAHAPRCYYMPRMNSSVFSGAWVHGEAYPRVDLNDVDSLECLAWAVCDGIFLPGNPPVLTGHHNWQWVIARTTLRLIYRAATAGVHCPPCTVTSHNAEQATREAASWQGTLWCTRRSKFWPARSFPVSRTPTTKSVVNVPMRVASSLSTEGAPATSLDDCKEDDGEEKAFHQFHWWRVQQSGTWGKATPTPCQVMHASPSKSCCIDLIWQTTKGLLNCETSLEEEEISWWPLVSPLTDGTDAATRDLAKRLMAAWKLAGVVSESPICPPAPTVLNIRQFLNKDLTGHGWS